MRRDAAYSVHGLDDLATQLGYGHSAATFDRRCLVVRCFAEQVLQLHTESSSVTKAVSHRSTAHEPAGPAETVAPDCTGSIRVAAGRRHEIGKRVQVLVADAPPGIGVCSNPNARSEVRPEFQVRVKPLAVLRPDPAGREGEKEANQQGGLQSHRSSLFFSRMICFHGVPVCWPRPGSLPLFAINLQIGRKGLFSRAEKAVDGPGSNFSNISKNPTPCACSLFGLHGKGVPVMPGESVWRLVSMAFNGLLSAHAQVFHLLFNGVTRVEMMTKREI